MSEIEVPDPETSMKVQRQPKEPNTSRPMSRGNLDAPELEWEDTITAVRKTRLVKPRTVALCGFANSSRHLAPYDKRTVEIWGCNEAYMADFMKTKEGQFRADRWFQMHLEEDWGRANNPNDPKHHIWMEEKHNFPIVMQEKFPQVPTAEAFPLDETDEMFFSNVYVIDLEDLKKKKWLDVYKHGYYTSSFAWMIAYAIWQGTWDNIEIWGFNMGTQSEYMYQKPGGEFWVAQAMAQGIDVGIAENSPILKGSLYGYEVADVLLPSHLLARKAELEMEIPALKDQAQQHHGARLMAAAMNSEFGSEIDRMQEIYEERHQHELAATSKVNFYLGAEFICDMYLSHLKNRETDGGGWVDRLTLEVQKATFKQDLVETRSVLDGISGAKIECRRNIALYQSDPEARASWKIRLNQLLNKEVEWTGKLAFLLGQISQVDQFIFTSENRSANMTTEADYGYIVVPDLYGGEIDALKLGEKIDGQAKTPGEAEVAETDEGGTGSSPSESGEPS